LRDNRVIPIKGCNPLDLRKPFRAGRRSENKLMLEQTFSKKLKYRGGNSSSMEKLN